MGRGGVNGPRDGLTARKEGGPAGENVALLFSLARVKGPEAEICSRLAPTPHLQPLKTDTSL